MTCTQCGAEIPRGGYFCGSCGRPVGYGDVKPGVLVEEAGLEDVPPPVPSMERPEPKRESPRRALCGVCLGAFPVEELSSVDGKSFCRQCSPIRARHSVTRPREEALERGGAVTSRDPWSPDPDERSGSVGMPGRSPSKKRRHGWKVLLTCLILAGLVAGGILVAGALSRDRIDELVAGADGDRDDARLLVRKYEVGERLSYGVEQKLEVTVEGSGVGGASEITIALDLGMVIDMETLSVDEEGNGEVRFVLHDFRSRTSFEVDGKSQGAPPELSDLFQDGMSFRMRMDPFLQPLGEVVYEEGAEALAVQGDPGGMLSEAVEGVPRRRLKVGDEWETRKTMPLPATAIPGFLGGGSISVAMKHKVAGYKPLGGRDCMVIAFEGDLESAKFSSGGPVAISMEIEGTAKGVIFFDYSSGRIVKEAMDAEILVSGEALGSSLEARVKLRMDVDLADG